MIDISVKNLYKAFDVETNILNGLSFEIARGERVGVLGKNGVGKTTLLSILVGALDYDSGEISIAADTRLGLMSQIPNYPEGYTAEDVLNTAHERQRVLARKIEDISRRMDTDCSPEILKEYDRAHAMFESLGGYNMDTERNKVANGLLISQAMRAQPFETLSGGEKTRVNLARLILEDTDILLLDEPTNHLDMKSTEWLEEYLQKFKGTVLIVSHDRYFLDTVVTRTIEIRDGAAEFYNGNYSFYVDEKSRRQEELEKKYHKEQAEIKRLSESADRLYNWGTGNRKLMQKSFAIKSRIERMSRTERPDSEKKIRGALAQNAFRGDMVLSLKEVSKAFDGRTLFEKIDLEVTAGEKIAVIGDNGAGKSTFLKLILGEEDADGGVIKIGPSVKSVYLPQLVTFKDPQRSVLDTLIYEQGSSPQSARNRLGAFKFHGDDVLAPVSRLSGGERSRLKLCMLMKDEINLMFLDEPTNHLDIASREWIEEILEQYDQALIFVSHDRYFISRFATRIWDFKDGTIKDFRGGFEEYRRHNENQARYAQIEKSKKPKSKPKPKSKSRKAPEKQMERLEAEITALEEQKAELERNELEFSSDYEKLMELQAQSQQLDDRLLELYELWEELGRAYES